MDSQTMTAEEANERGLTANKNGRLYMNGSEYRNENGTCMFLEKKPVCFVCNQTPCKKHGSIKARKIL